MQTKDKYISKLELETANVQSFPQELDRNASFTGGRGPNFNWLTNLLSDRVID
jgi:hypothetical protein